MSRNRRIRAISLQHSRLGLEGVLLLVLCPGFAAATVHIDDVHRLGLLHDQISTASQVYLLAKRRLDLPVNGQGVEQILVAGDFDHVNAYFEPMLLQVGFDLIAQLFIVDPNARAIGGQHIPQRRHSFC